MLKQQEATPPRAADIPIATGTNLSALFDFVSARAYTQPTHTYARLININAEWHSMVGSKHSSLPPPAVIQAFFGLPNSFTLFQQGLNLPWNAAEFSCSSASGPEGTQSEKSPTLTGWVHKAGPTLSLPPLLWGDNGAGKEEETDAEPRA